MVSSSDRASSRSLKNLFTDSYFDIFLSKDLTIYGGLLLQAWGWKGC
jgi:hypothetical protein